MLSLQCYSNQNLSLTPSYINADPNSGAVTILNLKIITNHFQQYFNWFSLKTIWIANGITPSEEFHFLISDIWIYMLLIISLYAFYETYRNKELSYYFIPFMSFIFMFLPQLFLLETLYQRYSLVYHVYMYLLTIILFINLLLKGVGFIIEIGTQNYFTMNIPMTVKICSNYIGSVILILIVFLPVLTTFYPMLSNESKQFDKGKTSKIVKYCFASKYHL